MTKPNLKEIEWAISRLENQESSESDYVLLAALYICRNEMLGITTAEPQIAAYSETTAPGSEAVGRYGDSKFLQTVAGIPPVDAWSVMDELMDTLAVVNRRIYESVMRKLNKL